MSVKKLNMHGFIAAPFTPMKNDRSIDLSKIEAYAKSLKAQGVIGAFVCGTTGEGMLLSLEERMDVAHEWIKYKEDNFKIIVHVGSTSSKIGAQLAMHAQKIGADAISAMGPVFLPASTAASLVEFCKPIAAAAPDLPFYYYHIPSVSHVNVSMKDFLLLGNSQIPNLVGIKFTHNDFMEMQQCLDLNGGSFEIFNGFDEMLLCGLVLGVKGAVGSTYNYMADCYREIQNHFENGELKAARDLQQFSVKVVEILVKYGDGIGVGKAIMDLKGVNCGPNRAPLTTMSLAEKKQIKIDLEAIGFFERYK